MKNITDTRGRPREFDEQEALTSAMHYFWEFGYDNTSLDNLLSVMGIKKSSFYATFKSKENLFSRTLSLYKEMNIAFLTSLKEEIGAKNTMLKLLTLTIEELKETGKVKGCLLVNSGKECYQRYKGLSEQITMEFSYILNLLIGFVAEAQAKGEIKSKKEAKFLASRYMNGLNGLIVTIQSGASQEIIDDLVKSLEEIVE